MHTNPSCRDEWNVPNPTSWYYGGPLAVEPGLANIPQRFSLSQNYPNPFNPTTSIRYSLDRLDKVSLTIYSITGAVVKNLVSGESQKPGSYDVVWDGKNNRGVTVASGMYFYKLNQGSKVAVKKMMLIR